MNSFDHTPLVAWGWSTRVADGLADHLQRGLVPGRVLVEHRGSYLVMTPGGERHAAVSGRFQHAATTAEDFPAVGDWVALEHVDDGRGVIHAVGPRHSRFARPTRGDIPGAQVVAANVDVVLLVSSLDHDFNLRRLERYLALAWSSGAKPVVVLNKADLCADVGARIADVRAVAQGVPVRAISAATGVGLESVTPLIETGRTVALLGSSGVGKSTIVNALLGWQRQQTQQVRADDQRGRHTTTVRELLPTPSGALLIDSPGMRAVGMWDAEEGIGTTFADVDELAAGCRFSDCRHTTEPGCAVQAAIDDGSLSAGRLASRRKLERELEALERRRAAGRRAEQRRAGKRMEKFVRSHMRAKYGHDGA
jgi:ribosome biogenesis GTPase / thiamine phosphate phosphatase